MLECAFDIAIHKLDHCLDWKWNIRTHRTSEEGSRKICSKKICAQVKSLKGQKQISALEFCWMLFITGTHLFLAKITIGFVAANCFNRIFTNQKCANGALSLELFQLMLKLPLENHLAPALGVFSLLQCGPHKHRQCMHSQVQPALLPWPLPKGCTSAVFPAVHVLVSVVSSSTFSVVGNKSL